MAATYTLATTTLTNRIETLDNLILLESTSGIAVGSMLYVTEFFAPGEAMKVYGFGAASGSVQVGRGRGTTAARPHSGSSTVFVATPDQLYDYDPSGAPLASPLVNPWINTVAGRVWYAYGDEDDLNRRWWQLMTTAPAIGALGIRQFPTVGAQ